MMTIEEAIEREKIEAAINRDLATFYRYIKANIPDITEKEEIRREKAAYHEQIAEWLSELNESRREVKK